MSASTRRRQQFPKRYSLQLLDEQFAFRPCSECRVKFKSSFCHHLHSCIHKRTEKAKKKLICNVCGKSFAKLPNFLFHRTLHKIGSLDGDKAGILNKSLHGHGGDDGERVSAAGRIKHRRKSNPRKIKAQSGDDSVVIPDDRQSEVSGISKEGIQSFVDDKDEARRPVTPVNTGISQNEPTLSSVTSHFPILNNPSLTRPYQEHDQQPNYHLEHGENHAESTDNASYEDSTHTDIPDQVQMYFPNGNQNCPVCGKYFVKRWNLNRHYRAHLDDRPYQCVKCGAYFKELGHLNQHMVTHACSKPVKCEFCFATFARNESLRYHMRKAHHAYPDVDSCDSSDKASRVESPKPARRSSVEIYHHSRDMPQLIRVHNLDRPSSDTMHSVRFHDEGMPTLDVGYSNGVCRERQKPIISPEFYNGEEQTSVMLSSKSNACQRDRRVSDTIEPTRCHEKGTCTANQVIFYDRQEQSSNMPPTVTYNRDESYMSDTTDQGRYHEIDMKQLGYSTGMYSGGSDTLNSVELKVLNRGEVALSTKSSPAGIRSIPETLQYHEEGDMPALMPRPTRVFRERHASDPTGLYDAENRASNLSYKHSKRNSMSDVNDPKRFSEGQSQTSSMMYPSETYSIERSAPLLVDPTPLYEGERPTCSRSYPTREHSARRDMSAMMRPVESYNGESQRKQTAFQPETHNRDRHIPDTIFNSETSVRHSAESVRGSSYVDDTQRDRKECIDRMSDHRHSSFAHEDHIKQFRECETRIDDNQNEAKHGRLRDEYKQQFNKRSDHFYYCNYCKAGFTKEVDLEKHVVYFCDLQPDGYKKCASYKQGKTSEYAVSSEVQHRGRPVFLAQRAEVTEEHTINESKHRTTIFTPNVSSDCNDNDNSRYNLDHEVKDHYMPIKSHGMSPKGRDMPIRGHDMQIKGHDLPIKGDEMTIEGHDTPIRGHDMPIKGHHMPIKGHEMEIKGHEMEVKGHSVPIKGHDMPIKGHEIEITGHLYNVSFPNEVTSHWSRNILTIPHDNSNLTEVRGNVLICKTEEKYSIDDRENNSSCDCCPQSDPYIISTANCCNQVERMQGDDRQIKESRNCARLGSLNSTIPQSYRNSYSNITTINNQTKHPSYNTSDPKRNIFLSSDHQFIGERFRSLSSAIPGEATAMHVSSLAMTQPSTFDSLDTPSKTIPKLEQTIKVANISDFPGQAFDCGINNGFNASNLCHDSPTTNDGVRNRHIPQLVPSHPDASLYLQSQGRKSSPIHSLERLSFSDLRRADYAATKLEQIRPDLAPIRDAFRSRKRGRPAKMRISGPRCMSNVVPLRNVDSVPKQKRDSISGQGFTASGSKFHDKDAPASDHQVPVQAENETPNTSSGSLTKMHKMYFCVICGDYQTKRMHICRKKKTEKRKRRKNAKKIPEKVSFQTGKRFLEKERKDDCNNIMPYANSMSMSVENNNNKESGYLPFSNNKNACLKGVRNNDHNISHVNSKGSFVRNVDSNNVSYVDCKITPVENNNNNINSNNNMNNNNSINNNNNDINNNCETTSNSPSDTHLNDFDPTKLPFDSAMHMCSYCNKYQPATHICRRTEVYPFKCGECDKKFKHRHFYEKHLKKKHVS